MEMIERVRRLAKARPAAAAASVVTGALIAAAAVGLLRPLLAIAIVAGAVALLRTTRGSVSTAQAHVPAGDAADPRTRPARSRAGAAIILLGFGAVGTAALGGGLHALFAQESALIGARTVPATVISVAMVEPQALKRGGFNYRPAVRHRYTVDGRVFESDRLYPMSEHLDARYAAALLSMYRPGQHVFTRVPADDPAAAYLAPKRRWALYGLLPIGLVFLLPAILIARHLFGRARRGPRVGGRLGVVQR